MTRGIFFWPTKRRRDAVFGLHESSLYSFFLCVCMCMCTSVTCILQWSDSTHLNWKFGEIWFQNEFLPTGGSRTHVYTWHYVLCAHIVNAKHFIRFRFYWHSPNHRREISVIAFASAPNLAMTTLQAFGTHPVLHWLSLSLWRRSGQYWGRLGTIFGVISGLILAIFCFFGIIFA